MREMAHEDLLVNHTRNSIINDIYYLACTKGKNPECNLPVGKWKQKLLQKYYQVNNIITILKSIFQDHMSDLIINNLIKI